MSLLFKESQVSTMNSSVLTSTMNSNVLTIQGSQITMNNSVLTIQGESQITMNSNVLIIQGITVRNSSVLLPEHRQCLR